MATTPFILWFTLYNLYTWQSLVKQTKKTCQFYKARNLGRTVTWERRVIIRRVLRSSISRQAPTTTLAAQTTRSGVTSPRLTLFRSLLTTARRRSSSPSWGSSFCSIPAPRILCRLQHTRAKCWRRQKLSLRIFNWWPVCVCEYTSFGLCGQSLRCKFLCF